MEIQGNDGQKGQKGEPGPPGVCSCPTAPPPTTKPTDSTIPPTCCKGKDCICP